MNNPAEWKPEANGRSDPFGVDGRDASVKKGPSVPENPLKTLNEHNADRLAMHEVYREKNKPQPNGIECPECGKELRDSQPAVTIKEDENGDAIFPPQKHIHCPACGYRGYRVS